jgi:hypothetical protein
VCVCVFYLCRFVSAQREKEKVHGRGTARHCRCGRLQTTTTTKSTMTRLATQNNTTSLILFADFQFVDAQQLRANVTNAFRVFESLCVTKKFWPASSHVASSTSIGTVPINGSFSSSANNLPPSLCATTKTAIQYVENKTTACFGFSNRVPREDVRAFTAVDAFVTAHILNHA